MPTHAVKLHDRFSTLIIGQNAARQGDAIIIDLLKTKD